MIDISNEHCFRLTEAPDHLPRRNGRRISKSTLFRWAQRGVRGHKLETVTIGGCKFTSREALQRFVKQLTIRDRDDAASAVTSGESAERQKMSETRELKQLGALLIWDKDGPPCAWRRGRPLVQGTSSVPEDSTTSGSTSPDFEPEETARQLGLYANCVFEPADIIELRRLPSKKPGRPPPIRRGNLGGAVGRQPMSKNNSIGVEPLVRIGVVSK